MSRRPAPDLQVLARHDLDGPERTAALAARLSPKLVIGDVLALSGPVGAGKSHLARALIATRLAAVGLVEDIPSPTFTLVQSYQADIAIWHADLYRLAAADDVWELGLEDAFETALTLIEWPGLVAAELPPRTLFATMAPGTEPEARRLTLACAAPDAWRGRLAGLYEGVDA